MLLMLYFYLLYQLEVELLQYLWALYHIKHRIAPQRTLCYIGAYLLKVMTSLENE